MSERQDGKHERDDRGTAAVEEYCEKQICALRIGLDAAFRSGDAEFDKLLDALESFELVLSALQKPDPSTVHVIEQLCGAFEEMLADTGSRGDALAMR